ncbi:Ca2+/Na+ antiporter [Nitrospira sp. KM1]|uniref:sodium:calcium antiporter n=1 Tax=Nitrospira sp. KM1 TaxID=1936990 RepID=UPI0013A76B1D|nr:sodium:calcium antiporter [Nitrospira sp. KM1]BCA55686.1 Ca2+/Na+ antiporter [Nitrospira sp. KM1]
MTLLLYGVMFVASVVVTLGACALFTNGIEWLGKRLKLSDGAVGSVLAAIGTTLPETSIPIVAIFIGGSREETEVGLGAILGAPFMLSTLVIPILAILLMIYAGLGKRTASFRLNYKDVAVDLSIFAVAYLVALACAYLSSQPLHLAAAVGLVGLYLYYVKLKFASSDDDEGGEPTDLGPLFFGRRWSVPPYGLIALQVAAGLGGLAVGAHLFVHAAESMAAFLMISPLILALLIAPLATELPEMSNSFLWLYHKKDRLAVGNVTGAMVFQGTIPVSVGLIGTEWSLAPSALITIVLAVIASSSLLLQAILGGKWTPWLMTTGAILYIGYALYLYGN